MTGKTIHVQRFLATSVLALALPMGLFISAPSHAAEGDTPTQRPMAKERNAERGAEGAQREGKKREHSPEAMFKELNLTEEQRTKIKAIMEGQRNNMKAMHEGRQQSMKEHQALVEAPTFDEGKARAVIEKEQAAEKQQRLEMLRTRHAIHQVLTPEQREKARGMEERMHKRMDRPMGPRPDQRTENKPPM